MSIFAHALFLLATADPAGPILLDGACDDAVWKRARAHPLGETGATLRFAADRDFVWLCIDPPSGSYATVDLYIRDNAGALHNIHASAQLGERVRGANEWPEWTWWNNRGWAANPVEFTGASPKVSFRPSRGRELQISRAKFPGKMWSLMLEVRALGPSGESATFPERGKLEDPATWATVRL